MLGQLIVLVAARLVMLVKVGLESEALVTLATLVVLEGCVCLHVGALNAPELTGRAACVRRATDCSSIGRECTGAWEESGDTCTVLHNMTCDETLVMKQKLAPVMG